VVTSNEGTKVRISWSEPAYNGGSPLFGYLVKIKTDTGSFVADEDDCDGSDQTTKANRFCLISMTTLRTAPFNLKLGQIVVATVEGINIIGNSVASDENTGDARIRTEPLSPSSLV
jgi:electron transfer flavoprotein alpha/beta subunit